MQTILANNDVDRKAAEAKLQQAKQTSADRYAILLCSMSHPSNTQVSLEVKQLSCVLLRRDVSIEIVDHDDLDNERVKLNLWMRLSDEARGQFKSMLLETLDQTAGQIISKNYVHKICNLATEV